MATATDDITTTAKNNFEDAASRSRSVAKQASGEFSGFASTFKDAIGKSLKDQPIATLAMAAGVGLVLGAIWKR